MQFLKIRKARKELKSILHHARHIRHMREDIAGPQALAPFQALEESARAARRGTDLQKMTDAGEALLEACTRLAPPRRHVKVRENVEVFFVAIAAAMAIRAYFFQPFKIPTGSMQPTLYGITLQEEPSLPPSNPLFQAANLILFGEKPQPVVRAKASGMIQTITDAGGGERLYAQPNPDETLTIYVGGVPHQIPFKYYQHGLLRMGEPIRAGEPLTRPALRKSGDYILVNRMKYNFVRPERGDIVVFDTRALTHPSVRKDAYYIKRLTGLPGETITLEPPFVRADGAVPDDPRFDKIFRGAPYEGYQFASFQAEPRPVLGDRADRLTLAADEYLFFGDNTNHSLDSRYFGAVKNRYVMGPAFFVCWPLDRAGPPEIPH